MEFLVNPGAEVLVFVPNWIQRGTGPRRLSHLLIPVVGALHARGHAVRLLQEAYDGAPSPSWRPWLDGAAAAVVWCAEMYPAVQIDGLLEFIALCQGRSQLPLVVGGGFFQLVDTTALAIDPRVTAIVHGPGEVVVPQLVAALTGGTPVHDVPGCTYRHDGRWVATARARRLPLDPASLRFLHDLDLRPYLHAESEIFGNDAASLQIHTGSGCAKRCPFCFDENTPLGLYPADAIVDLLAMLRGRYALRQVLFGELDFFNQTSRAVAVARGLRERNVDLRWFALGSVVDVLRLSDDELRLLAASGCHRIEMGSESGSASMLIRLRKRHQPDDALRAVGRLARVGIATTHNLLLGAPGETAADRRATVRLAFTIRRRDPHAHLHFRAYQVLPNTTLGAQAVRQVPNFPRTLLALRDYRYGLTGTGERAMPWLQRRDEAWVADLTSYLGPMALHRPDGPERWQASALRTLARVRCRTGWRAGLALDRRLRDRLAVRLSHTFVP